MGMKRTELEKLKGKKVEGLQKASGPYRSPDGGEDRRERRRREREMGLVPFAVKAVPEKPNPKRPCSVWHTIHIPKYGSDTTQTTGTSVCREAEERRERWIRACRKDYRRNGLFGKIFKLVYVPEHKVGNPNLGTIVHKFVV